MRLSRRGLVTLLGCAVFLGVLIRTAWMCDDAYITLRTVDNFVRGHGLRWNVAERVETFTHPAWTMLLSVFYAVTREPFFTTLCVQMALSVSTLALAAGQRSAQTGQRLFIIAAFLSSKAIVDFSTSGLENPLSHLLLVMLFLAWCAGAADDARRAWRVCALSSLVILCRFDLALLVLPVLVSTIVGRGRRVLLAGAAGFLPFVIWEVFSLVYYGVLIPNTALAKLATGVSGSDLMWQGLRYWQATALMDPITPLLLVGCTAFLAFAGGRMGRLMAAGIVLYLLYVLRVGGDFITGRFFSAPLVWALTGVAGLALPAFASTRRLAWAAGFLLLLGAVSPGRAFLTGSTFGADPAGSETYEYFGVADERRFYYPTLGLLRRLGYGGPVEDLSWVTFGREVRQRHVTWQVIPASNVGLFGYFAGPETHVLDRNGLTDPVIARLPALPSWRIGHFTRAVPDGYLESWRRTENVITDPAVHALADQVALLTQAPLWSVARWRAIVALRFGVTRGW